MQAWIFDVDGVLSSLEERQVVEPTLFPALTKILQQGDIVAFNTGRTIPWVEERVVDHLRSSLPSSLFEHVFFSCEKGGTYKQEGHEEIIMEKFVAPVSLRQKIHKLIHDEFSDSMFADDEKQTMVSVEKLKEGSLEFFQERRDELRPILKKYIAEEAVADTFHIAEDLIAVDIQHVDAGKDIGMQHILTWLESTGKKINTFFCFGDNPTDLHMGELLQQFGHQFTFAYVGTKPLDNPAFQPLVTQEKYDLGTAEALNILL